MKFVEKKNNQYVPTEQAKKISLAKNDVYKYKGNSRIKFWEKQAKELFWNKKWNKSYNQKGNKFSWFVGGKINVCYNAVDRHLKKLGNKAALVFIPENFRIKDSDSDRKSIKDFRHVTEKKQIITYEELFRQVNVAAELLLKQGIKKGDVVTIYLPLIPELVVFMLACARIGAIHSVVFSAFSGDALRARIEDGKAKLLITADKYYRKGKEINLLENAEQACQGIKIKKIIVKREKVGKNLQGKAEAEIKPVEIGAEDPLFILYTSGTTGKPKGVIHVNGGYAVQAKTSAKFDFNLVPGEIIWCTADIGWITGHTYTCYGPLLNGACSLLFEGMLDYPNPDRYLKIIEENKVNVFYTAPTALRLFALEDSKYTDKFKLKSLKILGTVGEPIDEHTWNWYFENIGKGNLPVIDTYWQTETGSSVINSLPGIGPFIPSYAGKSFPGIEHEIVDEKGKKLEDNKKGLLVQKPPFCPGLLRGVWHNEKKYHEYFKNGKYIAGDNAFEVNGNFRILGRSDDVIKVAGHRLSTAEIENAIESKDEVGEAAVVGMPDKLKGEVPVAFVKATDLKEEDVISLVAKKIGPIAKPAKVFFVADLPKTRSGKIIRRILKALLVSGEIGNTSTLVNPECVEEIKKVIEGG